MIYLDNNATTALDPAVLKAMLLDLQDLPYNPSAYHQLGRKAFALLTEAREKIASFFQVLPEEIVFTSSATEALNLVMRSFAQKGSHLITSDLEHSAVYNTAHDLLKKENIQVTFLPSKEGMIDPEEVEKAILPNTSLMVFSAVNAETGTLNDLAGLAQLAEKHNLVFLVDGVALLGKQSFTLFKGINAMVFSAHKIHGPKGIGFLILRKDLPLKPLITGGEQENLKRAGTENLAGILGLAKALELAYLKLEPNRQKMQTLRDLFETELKKELNRLKQSTSTSTLNIQINCGKERICNVSNLYFEGILAEDLLILLDQKGIAASHGSACSSKAFAPSRVISNMYNLKRAKSSVRFSFSRLSTEKEVLKAVKVIGQCFKQLA